MHSGLMEVYLKKYYFVLTKCKGGFTMLIIAHVSGHRLYNSIHSSTDAIPPATAELLYHKC